MRIDASEEMPTPASTAQELPAASTSVAGDLPAADNINNNHVCVTKLHAEAADFLAYVLVEVIFDDDDDVSNPEVVATYRDQLDPLLHWSRRWYECPAPLIAGLAFSRVAIGPSLDPFIKEVLVEQAWNCSGCSRLLYDHLQSKRWRRGREFELRKFWAVCTAALAFARGKDFNPKKVTDAAFLELLALQPEHAARVKVIAEVTLRRDAEEELRHPVRAEKVAVPADAEGGAR